jgi:hypothetical protein
MKKETIEEASNNYSKGIIENHIKVLHYVCFIDGAKWQKERSYSEEDIREAFRQGQDNMKYDEMYGFDTELTEQDWFNKFKKK